jgi:ribosomal-protein-alanine N-acetyltransferase|tara:strand:+ start:80 stop:583 length:504 start_codon:yes stop_codon:yes gene_type:complete
MRLNSDIVEINTQRFLLRQLITDDISDKYLSWLNREESPYIDYGKNHSTMEELKAYVSERERKKDVLFLAIFTKKKKHIGNIKYEPIDLIRKTATMGILIGDKDWRGKGVAIEVIKASAHYLNSICGVTTIFLGVNPNHQVAVSVYKKIGFKFKGHDKNNTKMIWQL